MKVPYSWLCDFAPLQTLERDGSSSLPSAELVQLLTDSFNDLGLVVEGVEWRGGGLDNVVVAKVLEIHAIDGADKIRRIIVQADESEALQIVCGAFNFEVGDKVPLAKIGAVLPGEFQISKRKMRGVESFGMLCSAVELDLGSDRSGLLILPPEVEVGAKISDALGIVPDVVFDLAIENNRPDANCIMGVARDLAAWLKIPFFAPKFSALETVLPSSSERLSRVEVSCLDHCDRLLVALFDDVEPKATSKTVARRLELAGMRPVSPVVDISNYLTLELGQPTHPYDIDKLAGKSISVRLAEPGESLTTLDGMERTLGLPDARGRESTDVVIVDGDGVAVGLAGIMGGEESEIKPSTKNVLLELAHFTPMTIARTSKRLGLRSEASARFERGVDPGIIEAALSRFSEMLGQSPSEVIEISSQTALVTPEIQLRIPRLNEILGTTISVREAASMLERIGFDVRTVDDASASVSVPTNRPDVEREIDVIEEVARHYGYRRIEKIRPDSKIVGSLNAKQRLRRQLSSLVVGMGFYETWCATLLAPGEQQRFGDSGPFLEVENPLALEESVLRRSLLPGLVRALRFNVNRKEEEVRFFEVGKVFSEVEGEISETERVACLLAYPEDDASTAISIYYRISDYFSLDAVSLVNRSEIDSAEGNTLDSEALSESWHGLHPTRSAFLVSKEGIVGQVGEVDPLALSEGGIESVSRVGYLEFDLDRLMALMPPPRTMRPISQFPIAEVDLAFEVPDSVGAREIEHFLATEVSENVVSAKLFDVYRGESLRPGHRSLAYSVRMSSTERTLSDNDISEIRNMCITSVEDRFAAKLRS